MEYRDGKDRSAPDLDRELAHLSTALRWRVWMHRIEAVLFASAAPVSREELARVVGRSASVELLISDLAADLAGRPFEVARVARGWMLRTRPTCASVIGVAVDVEGQLLDLSDFDVDVVVLAAIPITSLLPATG